MSSMIERARALRRVIEQLAETLDDDAAAESAELFPQWDPDGHDYAAKAMELGAEAVITERAVEGAKCIIVDSTAKALLDLAGYYRDKFDIPLVGVTGSVGKTTTKDMIALVVKNAFRA